MSSYYKGWPKQNSPYVQDLSWAAKIGADVLNKYKSKQTDKPKCVVFDIDDTLCFGDELEEVGVTPMELGEHDGEDIFILPPNPPIVKLAEYAKKLGYVVVIITARPKISRMSSITNMNYFKIPFDAIITNDGDEESCFKIKVRRKIAAKYHVCLTIGDAVTDVLCPGTAAFVKLPEPASKVAYAWIPPGI